MSRSATKLGLDISKFDRDFLDGSYSSHIDEDIQSANSSGDRYDSA